MFAGFPALADGTVAGPPLIQDILDDRDPRSGHEQWKKPLVVFVVNVLEADVAAAPQGPPGHVQPCARRRRPCFDQSCDRFGTADAGCCERTFEIIDDSA